jgi:hypothetical protein
MGTDNPTLAPNKDSPSSPWLGMLKALPSSQGILWSLRHILNSQSIRERG